MREPLEREKAVGRYPERMVTRREERRAFHSEGPLVAKDLVWELWVKVVLTRGTKRSGEVDEKLERGANVIPKILGAMPNLDLRT